MQKTAEYCLERPADTGCAFFVPLFRRTKGPASVAVHASQKVLDVVRASGKVKITEMTCGCDEDCKEELAVYAMLDCFDAKISVSLTYSSKILVL